MPNPKTDELTDTFERIAIKLNRALGWSEREIEQWFKTRNKTLGGDSPLKALVRGRGSELESWLDRILPILSTDYKDMSSDLKDHASRNLIQ